MAVVARISQVPSILRATSLLTDQVGDAVYIRADRNGAFKVAGARTASIAKMPAIGIIIKKWDFTQVLVQTTGVIEDIYSGLIAGKTYWVGENGQLSVSVPPLDGTTQRAYTQVIGVAMDEAVLLLKPSSNLVVKVG